MRNLTAGGSRSYTKWMILFLMAVAPGLTVHAKPGSNAKKEVLPLEVAKIFFEYNSSPDANDLGVHVFLDGEDWKSLKIVNPDSRTIFHVQGKLGYAQLGMTELFFEGAEPSLDEFPLADLLALFPQGTYQFEGKTVDGVELTGTAELSYAIPAGPEVAAVVGPGDSLVITWGLVDDPAAISPEDEVEVVGYQVIVEDFQVTLGPTDTSVTVPPEYVATLDSGVHLFEVLAIEAGGNQTITEGSFTLP